MRNIQELKAIQNAYNDLFKSLQSMVEIRKTLQDEKQSESLYEKHEPNSQTWQNLKKLAVLIKPKEYRAKTDNYYKLVVYRTILTSYLVNIPSDLNLTYKIKQWSGLELFCTSKDKKLTKSDIDSYKCHIIDLGTELNNFAIDNQNYSNVIDSLQLLLLHAALKYFQSGKDFSKTPEYVLVENLYDALQKNNQAELQGLLTTARLQMSDDRTLIDIIGHILLALTGIGLIAMTVNRMVNGSFFFTMTNQQNIIDEIINEAHLVNRQM